MSGRRVSIQRCAVLGVVLAGAATAGPIYSVTDLGSLRGPNGKSSATGINNLGYVVGYTDTAFAGVPVHAFRWDPNSGLQQDLGDLPGGLDSSMAHGINDNGDVTGRGSVAYTGNSAFRWKSGSPMANLGAASSVGRAINNSGVVVGRAGGSAQAVRWSSSGALTFLGSLPGGTTYGEAMGINTAGVVVGDSDISNGIRAFRWNPSSGNMTNLGALSSSGPNPRSEANAINDLGWVVGESNTSSGQPRAVLWDANNKISNLGVLSGGNMSVGWDVNLYRDVVGWSNYGGSGFHAMLWTTATGMIDLNQHLDASGTGWTLGNAYGINDNGWIVGTGSNPAGLERAYLLRPVPEPGTLSMLVAAGLAMIRFRRQ